MKKLISLLVALVLVVPVFAGAQGATSTLPDPGTLPDSPLYFLKSWREGIQLFFTFDAKKKAEQYLHLAEVRLAEYEKMLEKGKEDIAARTLEKYESQLNRALTKAEELKEKGEEVGDELWVKTKEVATKRLVMLRENLEKVPESAKGGIQRALETAQDKFFGYYGEGDDVQEENSIISQDIPENEVVDGELVGYYTSITRTAFEETKACDAFIVTGGDARLRGYFQRLIEIGNSVNSKNERSEVVLNLNFQGVDATVKDVVVSSSREAPIGLRVRKPAVVPMGVGPCFSFVEILGVKNDLTDIEGLDNLLDDEGLEDELNDLLEGLE